MTTRGLMSMVVLFAACGGADGPPQAAMPSAPTQASSQQAPRAQRRQQPSPSAGPATVDTACNEQPPQPFLMRSSYRWRAEASEAERQRRKAVHRRTIEYRTRAYGYVEGFGKPSWNHLEPKHYAQNGSFFGVGILLNNRALRALECVEHAITQACDGRYKPEVLHGLRDRNTFYNGEVSNHLYGIAVDIDPDHNSCCGCLAPMSEWAVCREAKTAYQRTNIPRCWIEQFERYGFYWLGHDELEDTMHFEFLGDPDNIAKLPPSR